MRPPCDERAAWQLDAAPKLAAGALYVTRFVLNETVINADLLRTWTTQRTTNLLHGSDSYAVQYFFTDTAVAPRKEILEHRIMLASQTYLTVENRQSFPSLISLWGAFANLVMGLLGIVFTRMNKNAFFDANPAWGKVNERLVVEDNALSAVDREVQKLLQGKDGAHHHHGDDGGVHSPLGSDANFRGAAAGYGGLLD